jgi:hypothetical protein
MTQFSDNLQFLTVIMLLRKALQLELEQGLRAPSTRFEISLSLILPLKTTVNLECKGTGELRQSSVYS